MGSDSVESNTKLSGYAWRNGSVFGSQVGLRTSVSRSPRIHDWMRYGPEVTGFLANSSGLGSLAAGTGTLVGRVAANGKSQWGLGNLKTMVLSSGVEMPGAVVPGFANGPG